MLRRPSPLYTSQIGDDGATEVEGSSRGGTYDLHGIGVGKLLIGRCRGEGLSECSDLGLGVIEGSDQLADMLLGDKGLIPLKVDKHISLLPQTLIGL